MTTYDCAMRKDSLRNVCQEDTSQTSTGQPYTMTQINPQDKSTNDSDDMLMLISDEDDQDNPQQGAIKK